MGHGGLPGLFQVSISRVFSRNMKKLKTVVQRECITAHQSRKQTILSPKINFQNYFIHHLKGRFPLQLICPWCIQGQAGSCAAPSWWPQSWPVHPHRHCFYQDLKNMSVDTMGTSKHSKNHSQTQWLTSTRGKESTDEVRKVVQYKRDSEAQGGLLSELPWQEAGEKGSAHIMQFEEQSGNKYPWPLHKTVLKPFRDVTTT